MEGTPAEQKLARRIFPYRLRTRVKQDIAAESSMSGPLADEEETAIVCEGPQPALLIDEIFRELHDRLNVLNEAIHTLERLAENPPEWI